MERSFTDEAGTKRQEKQTLEVRSNEGKLTGMSVKVSGNGGIPFEVQQMEGKVNPYGFLTPNGGEHLCWKLELEDGDLTGSFPAPHNNPSQWKRDRMGAMTVTKIQASTAPQ